MVRLQQLGPIAAYLNAFIAISTLLVALVLIGPEVMADRARFVELALRNPTPLIIQDILKFVSAALAIVLIVVLHNQLLSQSPRLIRVATVFGFLSVTCLLANAILSLFATTQAASFAQNSNSWGSQLNLIIGILAFAAIIANGPWYWGVNSSALKANLFPKPLSYIGMLMGILSFLPPLGIIVLLLSIVWSLWLGIVLSRSKSMTG